MQLSQSGDLLKPRFGDLASGVFRAVGSEARSWGLCRACRLVGVRVEHGAIGAMDPYVASAPKLRILCLHGRCQTGSTFEKKLERVAVKSESFAEFVSPVCNEDLTSDSSSESCRRHVLRFVDGPLELPLQHGERINTILICKRFLLSFYTHWRYMAVHSVA